MRASNPIRDYALGNSDAEHERLIRQATRLAPLTERFLRDAGIGPGQRVLDLGSGIGDVAMLAARLVGPSGEVVGVERDLRSITRARVRATEAGLHHVVFTQSDVCKLPSDKPFDAAVGRYILMYLPDPVTVLRSLCQVVRPGGVIAFQEPSWDPVLALSAKLPLWSACSSLIIETFRRCGVNAEMGPSLYAVFREAGLPAPAMHMEVLLGNDQDFTRGMYDLLCSLRPQTQKVNLNFEALGNFKTLPERLQAEVTASKRVVTWLAVVSAWSSRLLS
jgi:ubiquinone/menaquinone biosynthesis C-methylase UbiE